MNVQETAAPQIPQNSCRACGIKLRDGRPFCSPLCAKAKALEAIAFKESLVAISDDLLICKLCKKELQAAGSHFKRIHGLETRELSRSERQAMLGIPQGGRLATRRIRERCKELGKGKDWMMEMRQRQKTPLGKARRRAHVTKSMHQLTVNETFFARTGASRQAQHAKALGPWRCGACGKEESRTAKYRARKFCQRCIPAALLDLTKQIKEQSRAARTQTCAMCGTTFVRARKGRPVRFCSKQCIGMHRTKAAP